MTLSEKAELTVLAEMFEKQSADLYDSSSPTSLEPLQYGKQMAAGAWMCAARSLRQTLKMLEEEQ